MNNNNLHFSFVLHKRLYRDSSLIVELFSEKLGRCSIIAKGVRKKVGWYALLQVFIPIIVSWRGRGELPNLSYVESAGSPIRLEGNALACGFYLNELLMRLLHKNEECQDIFNLYLNSLRDLQNKRSLAIVLRNFEKHLLSALGYSLEFTKDINTDKQFDSKLFYKFVSSDGGFVVNQNLTSVDGATIFSGRSLIAIAKDEYTDIQVLRDAKRLMRLALAPLIGEKSLLSRELIIGNMVK